MLTAADFDLAYDDINSYNHGSDAGYYLVQAGDTLSSIAASLWGDDALWYKLAEVNGLTGDESLVEGTSLTIPAGVIRNTNNASTFTPYDPADIIGNLNPTTPKAPKAKKNCGAFGQIILAIIAVAVVAILHVPVTNFFAGTGFTGGTVVEGASTAALIEGGAAAGAAGSIASQAVGVATGIQDKFSWNAVALAAIGGGVGAGVAKFLPNASAFTQAAVGSAVTQGIGVATGLQKEFSWAGVAAAGVGAAFGNWVGGKLPITMDPLIESTIVNTASGIANAATRSVIEGTDFGDNLVAALPDIVGQTIGTALADGIAEASQERNLRRAGIERSADGFRDRFGDTSEVEAYREAGLDAAAHPRSPEARERFDQATRAMLDANRGDVAVAAFLEHTDPSVPPVYAEEATDTIAVTAHRDYLLGPTIDRAGIWVGEVRHEIGQAVGQYIEDNPGVGIALQVADAGFAIAGPARYLGGQVLGHFQEQAAGFIADQMRSDPARGRRMWAPDLADDGGHGFVFAGSVILGGLAALRVRANPNAVGSNLGNVRFRPTAGATLRNMLRGFETRTFQAGSNTFRLDRTGMTHIMERHHPDYWNGSQSATQTFFDRALTADDIADIAMEGMRQNREVFAAMRVTTHTIQRPFTYQGQRYMIGIRGGRVGQLYPLPGE